jgi:hypothetical protein
VDLDVIKNAELDSHRRSLPQHAPHYTTIAT